MRPHGTEPGWTQHLLWEASTALGPIWEMPPVLAPFANTCWSDVPPPHSHCAHLRLVDRVEMRNSEAAEHPVDAHATNGGYSPVAVGRLLIVVASRVVFGLSCPACGIFPDQGWNLCPLR